MKNFSLTLLRAPLRDYLRDFIYIISQENHLLAISWTLGLFIPPCPFLLRRRHLSLNPLAPLCTCILYDSHVHMYTWACNSNKSVGFSYVNLFFVIKLLTMTLRWGEKGLPPLPPTVIVLSSRYCQILPCKYILLKLLVFTYYTNSEGNRHFKRKKYFIQWFL